MLRACASALTARAYRDCFPDARRVDALVPPLYAAGQPQVIEQMLQQLLDGVNAARFMPRHYNAAELGKPIAVASALMEGTNMLVRAGYDKAAAQLLRRAQGLPLLAVATEQIGWCLAGLPSQ